MRPILLLAAALAAVSSPACAPREAAAPPPRLAWTMEDFQRSWSADGDTLPEVWLSLHYPRFTAPPGSGAADSLNAWVEQAQFAAARSDSAPGSLEGIAGTMIANFQALHREFPGAPAAAWYFENECLVGWDSLGVISMRSLTDTYTGGAHGFAARAYGVFDSETGRRLGLGDLAAPDGADSLRRIAEQAFRSARDLPPDAALEREGFWFEGGHFGLTANFGLERDGLVFFYNSYEVAPYVMGPTEVRLAWDAVKGLLRRDGPLAPIAAR